MGAPKGTKRLYNAIGNRSGLDYERLNCNYVRALPLVDLRSPICDKEIKYKHRVELASNSPNNSAVPRFHSNIQGQSETLSISGPIIAT